MEKYLGTGKLLHIIDEYPYIGQPFLKREKVERRILNEANKGRPYRGKGVETIYYLASKSKDKRDNFKGIEDAILKILIHGTTESWSGPGKEPEEYKKHMSYLKEVKLLVLLAIMTLHTFQMTTIAEVITVDSGANLPPVLVESLPLFR